MDYSTLNERQLEAVCDLEGHILVIAGAGSGKTRVLTSRICNLIDHGVSPYKILAITFTNKAAREMKERVELMIPNGGAVWTSTFHSMCAKFLRVYADRLGYTKEFTIYTEIESERVIKRIIKDNDFDEDLLKDAKYHINRAKTLGLNPNDYYQLLKESTVYKADRFTRIFVMYEEELKKCNAMDFDDLLIKFLYLLETDKEVLSIIQDRFQYIHVDEFQDTNSLQYKIVKLLCQKSGNLFVVGDEDQSIYSWRGAEIKNILNFKKDFKDAKIYKLEQNYRSTSSILDAANRVIRNNKNRNDKNLWCDKKDDNSVVFKHFDTDRDEALYVTQQINHLVNTGENYRDIAILVRQNVLTRLFEESFNLHAIPYKVFGGFRFYERKEIKDCLAYVKLALNPSDNDSVLRVINYPKRKIGNKAIDALKSISTEHNCSYFNALINPQWFPDSIASKLNIFTNIIVDLIDKAKNQDPSEFMEYVINKSQLEETLGSSNDAEDRNRLENIKELISETAKFEEDNPEGTISDYMQSTALVSDTDEMTGDNFVTIATVHAVKGLEFNTVFLPAMENGVFPCSRALDGGDLEEERRLMYVAITRAKDRLYVTNCEDRMRYGHKEDMEDSGYINEMGIDTSNVHRYRRDFSEDRYTSVYDDNNYYYDDDRDDYRYNYNKRYNNNDEYGLRRSTTGGYGIGMNTYGNNPYQRRNNVYTPSHKPSAPKTNPTRATNPIARNQNVDTSEFAKFKKDTIVEHRKFGRGYICETEGDGQDKKVWIMFKDIGKKCFSLAVAINLLKIVED